jgi:thrombospondin motif-containing protein 18
VVVVNEGRHFESVFVISHEIGHNLGMRHDGPQADNDCDPTSHIMSPTLGSGKITWSPCSRKYLDMFLETSQSKCLLDKAKSEIRLDHDADGRLPGERFDADRQCTKQ